MPLSNLDKHIFNDPYNQNLESKDLYVNTRHSSQNEYLPMPNFPSSILFNSISNTLSKDRPGAPRFNVQNQLLPITSSSNESFEVSFGPRVEGGFFMHDDKWTCYRRNYFKILSFFNLSSLNDPNRIISAMDSTPLYVDYNNARHLISCFKMTLTAFCHTNTHKKVDLVIHSNKHRASNSIPSPRAVLPGGREDDPVPTRTPISPPNAKERMTTVAIFDRVQFRSATANNGKRKAIQQYFRLMIELHAVCSNGSSFKVAETISDDIVVRGRSPGHYADVEKMKQKKKNGFSRHNPYSPTIRRNSWTTSLVSGYSDIMSGHDHYTPLSAVDHNEDIQSVSEIGKDYDSAFQDISSAPLSPTSYSTTERFPESLYKAYTAPGTRTASPIITPLELQKDIYQRLGLNEKDNNGKDVPVGLFGNYELGGVAW